MPGRNATFAAISIRLHRCGVESSRMPPGSSSRCMAASTLSESAMCSITSLHSTRLKLRSGSLESSDVVAHQIQVRILRGDRARVIEMRLVEVGRDHFAEGLGQRRQIDPRAETDLDCASRPFPRAPREASPMIQSRREQWSQLRVGLLDS